MARRRYLLLYDIREDGRLRRVHDIARSFGQRFQYSVFLCDLSSSELIQVQWELGEVMDQSVDSVALIDLGPSDREQLPVIYIGPRYDLPDGRSTVL